MQQGNQSQYSRLQGTWTYSFTYTASGIHLYELQTRWGATVDVLSDPQFQWTQPTGISPAQYTLSAHLLSAQWPAHGPLIIQSFIDAQWQATVGQGGQSSVIAGVQLAPRVCQTVMVGGQLSVDLFRSGGGMIGRVDRQGVFSASLIFPF